MECCRHQIPRLDLGKAIQAGAQLQTQGSTGTQGQEALAGGHLACDLLKATLLQYRSAMSTNQVGLFKALAVLDKLHSMAHQTAGTEMVQLVFDACFISIGAVVSLRYCAHCYDALIVPQFVLSYADYLGQTLH